MGWFCGSNSSPVASHPYDCRPYAGLRGVDGVVAKADFPSCWDGQTPPRPFNTAYPTGRGVCPEGFPHLIPAVSLRFHFGFMDPCAGATPCTPADADANIKMTLSSGAYYSFHADLWNTWTQSRLDSLVDSCLNAHVKCGAPLLDVDRRRPVAAASVAIVLVVLAADSPGLVGRVRLGTILARGRGLLGGEGELPMLLEGVGLGCVVVL